MTRARITQADLEALATHFNKLAQTPLTYEPGNYHISYAYGGVALHQLQQSGGIIDVFRAGHMPKRELYQRMQAYTPPTPAPTIYLVCAEHYREPGRVLLACASKEIATQKAVDLVRDQLADSDMPQEQPVTADNWDQYVADLQDYHGAGHCYVEIISVELQS